MTTAFASCVMSHLIKLFMDAKKFWFKYTNVSALLPSSPKQKKLAYPEEDSNAETLVYLNQNFLASINNFINCLFETTLR